MNKEIHRMQQLAGIKSLNELSIRKNYFHEWKLIVLKHLQECCNDGFYCELIEPFKQIKDPYDAIEFLVQNEEPIVTGKQIGRAHV